MGRHWACAVTVVVLGCAAGAWGQVPAATVNANDQAAREKLGSNLQEIGADETGVEKVLNFMRDVGGVTMEVDWAGLERVEMAKDTPVTISLKGLSQRRALTEILEQAGGDKVTFWMENGVVKVVAKDLTAAARQARAARLVARARETLGEPRVAADLLIQARVVDGTGDASLLAQVMGTLKERNFADALSADGSVVLAADFNASETPRAKMGENLKEITANAQGLGKALNFLRDNMEVNCSVDWAALAKVGVTPDTPVTVSLKEVSFEKALQAILDKAAPGKVGMAMNDGILNISTVAELETSPRYECVWAYDVREVVEARDSVGGTDAARPPAVARQARVDALIKQVKGAVDAKGWSVGGRYVEESGGILFVRQKWGNQEKVAQAVSDARAGK